MPAKRHNRLSRSVREKLKQARVARLATVDASLAPHVVPICFAYDGDVFYTAIDQKAKHVQAERLARVRNIAVNPRVALLIDEYDEDWTRLWYILIFGHATFISARRAQGRARAISILKAKYAQYSESMLAEDAPIIRIVPERTVFWNAV